MVNHVVLNRLNAIHGGMTSQSQLMNGIDNTTIHGPCTADGSEEPCARHMLGALSKWQRNGRREL